MGIIIMVIGGWAFMIFAWAMPAFVTIIMSNVTNWIGHMQSFPGNYRTYNLKDKSVIIVGPASYMKNSF